jgi:hypothetical protein
MSFFADINPFRRPDAPPAVPDYTGAAVAQGAANIDAARVGAKISNPNYYTPYGTQTVAFNGDQPTVTQTLTPEAQKALDEQQKGQYGLAKLGNLGVQNAQNTFNTPFSFGGQVQTGLDTSQIAKMPVNAGTTGQQAIMSRLEPSLQRNRVSTETQLVNQGLRPGTEAYDNAIQLLGQQENDARTQAVLQGIGLDTGANAQGFNQALQGGQFANTANQQALAQALTQRQTPLNEINALMSGSQVANPSFGAYQGQNVAPAPLFAATQAKGAADLNIYNTQTGTSNANRAGLYQLGASALA